MCAENAKDIYSMDQGKQFCLQCFKNLVIHTAQEPQAEVKKSCTYSV